MQLISFAEPVISVQNKAKLMHDLTSSALRAPS